MDSREFAEWMAYYRIDPFGSMRGDLHAGIVASVVANVNRDEKAKPEPFTPQDFMPHIDAEPERQSVEDQLEIVRMLHEAFGGTLTSGVD